MVMRIAKIVTPTGKAGNSQGSVSNQGLTYNQAGLTFNEGTVTYGGFYGFSNDLPIMGRVFQPTSRLKVANTLQQLYDQGYTYNQAGFTFNEVGVTFGGVYGYSDIVPIVSLARNIVPSITSYSDIYTTPIPPGANSGMLIGILGLTYP